MVNTGRAQHDVLNPSNETFVVFLQVHCLLIPDNIASAVRPNVRELPRPIGRLDCRLNLDDAVDKERVLPLYLSQLFHIIVHFCRSSFHFRD